FALDRQNQIGSLHPGKKGDILLFDAPNHNHIPYRFGTNRIDTVIKNGKIIL
ncbi:MAG: amidohydrolase family protein, partial [Planctomycetes bacterium]|nr:amidohydrolase family protein [Planctomycetota bacterium]